MTKTCCVTGHKEITKDKIEYVTQELNKEILRAVDDGFTHFLSGFANSVDLIFATIVAELKRENKDMKLEATIAYRKRTSCPDKLLQKVLGQCDIVGIHSEAYRLGCFNKNSRFMISVSDRVIAVYDGRETGGTVMAMRYACLQNKELITISI